MRKFIATLMFVFFMACAFTQIAPPEYHVLIKQADSLYKAKDYLNSGLKYSGAFQTFGGLGYPTDRYNAACSWSLAGNADSAFYHLTRIVERSNFADYRGIVADKDFKGLHEDVRWAVLVSQIKRNKDKNEIAYNRTLLHQLDSLVAEDQRWRNYAVESLNGELGSDIPSMDSINRMVALTDSLNYLALKDIFSKYGFPNHDLVGQEGSQNFWLLVQHQDRHPDFQESVLRKMKIEVDAKKASGANYAYLVDRVKVNTGQQQVYGTQIELNDEHTSYMAKNVIDPTRLNERRLSMGLESMESYIATCNSLYSGTLKKRGQ